MDKAETNNLALIPINQCFLDVFETFMDDNQKTKIRANGVRQYIEGIIDLLLKDKTLGKTFKKFLELEGMVHILVVKLAMMIYKKS